MKTHEAFLLATVCALAGASVAHAIEVFLFGVM